MQPFLLWKNSKNYLFECVSVALGIQLAVHVRHIGICGLPRSTVFFYVINGTIFEKKKRLLNTKCVLISSVTSVFSLLSRRTERDMINNI